MNELMRLALVDLFITVQADAFVGTLSSNWARLADELRRANGPPQLIRPGFRMRHPSGIYRRLVVVKRLTTRCRKRRISDKLYYKGYLCISGGDWGRLVSGEGASTSTTT